MFYQSTEIDLLTLFFHFLGLSFNHPFSLSNIITLAFDTLFFRHKFLVKTHNLYKICCKPLARDTALSATKMYKYSYPQLKIHLQYHHIHYLFVINTLNSQWYITYPCITLCLMLNHSLSIIFISTHALP